jgi:hypothetical protein
MVLAGPAGPAFRLGIEDFSILVLARCDARTLYGPLVSKTGSVRPRTGLRLVCNHDGDGIIQGPRGPASRMLLEVTDDLRLPGYRQGAVISGGMFPAGTLRLVTIRRQEGTRLQLRVDGQVEGERAIPAEVNLVDELPMFIGADASPLPAPTTTFDGGIAAVVVIRGPLTDAELGALEAFLMRSSGAGAAPLSAP